MERLRRTMMFVPGNNPGMMADAHIYGPDSIMLDLEDSVSMHEKDTARLLVYNALKTIDYGDTEMVVRINPSQHALWQKRYRGGSEGRCACGQNAEDRDC